MTRIHPRHPEVPAPDIGFTRYQSYEIKSAKADLIGAGLEGWTATDRAVALRGSLRSHLRVTAKEFLENTEIGRK
jgi:hypothetical protein